MKNIFEQLLHALQVPYTKRFVKELYETHPHRDNLLGLWQMCKAFGIKAHAVEMERKVLDDLSVPCILHVSGRFVVVDCIENGRVDFYWDGKRTSLPYEQLEQIWDGIALIVESDDNAAEPDFKTHKKAEVIDSVLWTVLLILAVCGCIALPLRFSHSLVALNWIFSAVDAIGIAVCGLLLQKQVSAHSTIGDKICSLFHQKDCNKILESRQAKIGNYSWSELGMGYFLMHFICSSTGFVTPTLVALTSLCALPYCFWSIYYQARIAKQWCVLCVIVQVLLCLNALATMVWLPNPIPTSFTLLVEGLAIISSLSLMLSFATHYAVQAITVKQELQSTIRSYRSLKANPEVFNCLLHQKRHVDVSQSNSAIVFGNPEAEYKVTILSNPHCNPCAKLHQTVEDLLHAYEKDICVQYIFCSFNESLKESARFLVAVYQQKGKSAAQDIYTQWFEHGKFKAEDFFAAFPEVDTTTPDVTAEMERHDEWTKRNGYASTPTILVNGYEMPSDYKLGDLRYFM